eukprot:TRINITY_DN5157_c0_g1_i1.p1 TRINITY_DN5157_c0_g1~~TRINITY_DN5157_c0_g1_i1.p1  ORF type:complete len:383 (-),score=6.12 TRINITY_DN5157_c0_g1_i1:186-1334(-)
MAGLLPCRQALAFALLASICFAASVQPADAAAPSTTLTFDQIQNERVAIYDRVMQQLGYFSAKKAAPGKAQPIPSPPLSNMTAQVIVLDVASVVANGYTLHEFTLPPGVTLDTSSKQVMLLYSLMPNVTAPFESNDTITYIPTFASLSVLPYPGVPGPHVKVDAPATAPITVTFPVPSVNDSVPQCTTFDLNGSPVFLNTSIDRAAGLMVCQSQSLGDFTLAVGADVPTTPPTEITTPPPAAPAVPPPTPEVPATPPPVAPIAPTPSGNETGGDNSNGSTDGTPSGGSNDTSSSGNSDSSSSSSSSSSAAIWVGVTFGACALVILALLLVWCMKRAHKKKELEQMDMAAEKAANLETALIGGSRAPAAGALRTKAVLENETF